MEFRNYSAEQLQNLIKEEVEHYRQALIQDENFELVKQIYLKIKELKKALLLKEIQNSNFLN